MVGVNLRVMYCLVILNSNNSSVRSQLTLKINYVLQIYSCISFKHDCIGIISGDLFFNLTAWFHNL